MKRSAVGMLVLGLVVGSVGWGAPVGAAHDAIDLESIEMRTTEDGGDAIVLIRRGEHGTGPATVRLRTEPGTAEPGSDYQTVDRIVEIVDPRGMVDVIVPILTDDDPEPPETFRVVLSDPSTGTVLGKRREATVLIVDDDGASRVSFFPKPFQAFETRSFLDVALVRSGSDAAPASVAFGTRADTGEGAATAEEDYESTSGTAAFTDADEPGLFARRHAIVQIPLMNDGLAEGDEQLFVDLADPTGAVIEGESSAAVTILDDEVGGGDVEAPYTAFHYPLDGRKYRRRDFKRMLVFNEDDVGGSGMRSVQVALRKRFRSGRCKWWNGEDFKKRACGRSSAIWVKRRALFDVEVVRVKRPLQRTAGTRVRNYVAFSRGIDVAGNVQGDFRRGQNVMKFYIK